jgi:hypothetical protein
MEIWKDIPGFEGWYQASDLGNIRSVERMVKTKGGALRHSASKVLAPGGPRYALVILSIDGKRKTRGVHRLVCTAFHGAPPPNAHAAHNDGDISNNKAKNLRWATAKENCLDRVLHKTWVHGARVNTAKMAESDIQQVKIRAANGESRISIAKDMGVHRSSIDQLLRGDTWQHLIEN